MLAKCQTQEYPRRLTLQPPNVFLLLLVVNVVGNEQSHAGVDAAILDVLLEEDLEVLIQLVEVRTGIQCLPRPALLRSLRFGKVGVRKVSDILDDDITILHSGLDRESALARTLDADVGTGGEALSGLFIVLVVEILAVGGCNAVLRRNAEVPIGLVALVDGALGAGTTRLGRSDFVDVIIHGVVLIIVFYDILIQIRDGECDADLLLAVGAGKDDLLLTGFVFELEKLDPVRWKENLE